MPARRISINGDEPISLDEAKLHLKVDCDDDDLLITALITTARQAAENDLQRALVPSTWRLSLDKFAPIIELPMPPTVAVSAVRYWGADGVQDDLQVSDCQVDAVSEPGRLLPAPSARWPATQSRVNAVEVDYTAGYAEVPTPVRHWMLLAIGDMYTRRERSAEKPVVAQGFAEGLLDTYRMPTL